jgi:hypothetical protein
MNRALLSSRQIVIMAIFLTSLVLVIGNLLYTAAYNPAGAPRYNLTIASVLFYISMLCPFPIGIWTGLTWPRSHPIGYILVALSIALINFVVGILSLAAIYGFAMFGEGVVYQGITLRYETVHWINYFAGSFLIPTFLFTSGALLGDFLEGRVSEKMGIAIVGIVGALVAALGSIFAALVS